MATAGFERHLEPELLDELAAAPAVFLHGARQTGKSYLARRLADGTRDAVYAHFDDIGTLAAARSDPQGFLARRASLVVLDEVQRCPELFLAIKAEIDRDRTPGRFLLTGSASILLLPRLADALVGRMRILTLQPLSQGEIEGRSEGFVDRAFAADLSSRASPVAARDVWRRVATGGFPEVVKLRTSEQRASWFDAYVETLLQREIRDLSEIESLTRVPTLFRLLAARLGGLLNVSELSRSSQLPHTTLTRYLALLEGTFLLRRVPPWSPNLGKRLVKSAKLYLVDSGLAVHMLGFGRDEIGASAQRGALLENFVLGELERQCSWSRTKPRLFHYRSHAREEVDFVLENRRGDCVGVEVKATATLRGDDFAGLRGLADALGKKLAGGVLLYLGESVVPFGDRLAAYPIASLWSTPVARH